jgi:hypothetical protein
MDNHRVAIVVGAGGDLIAYLIAYLVSDAAGPVSGAILPAYGA